MRYRNERGAVLPIALLILLLLIVMAAGFVYEIRTQSSFNAAVKLNSFYKITAENELRRRIATMNDGINNNDWLSASANTIGFVDQWRLGGLLKGTSDPDFPDLGVLIESSFPSDGLGSDRPEMNAGLLPLDFRMYAKNNRDDPAYYLASTLVNGVAMDGTWDTDGKIVLTVQVFSRDDDSFDRADDIPLVTVSALVQSTGMEFTTLGLDVDDEGNAAGEGSGLNQGQGTANADTNDVPVWNPEGVTP